MNSESKHELLDEDSPSNRSYKSIVSNTSRVSKLEKRSEFNNTRAKLDEMNKGVKSEILK